MLKARRQETLLHEIKRRGMMSVPELARILDASAITVRRDLRELAGQGRLERIRGGARPLTPHEPEPPVVLRELVKPREKRAIGLAAARLIDEANTIAIVGGSTTLELAKAVSLRTWQTLHVVTNSFTVANELIRVPGVKVVLVGGSINADEMATYGALAEEAINRIHVQTLFLGCRGIDPRAGITHENQEQILVDRAFVAAAARVIILADHSKLGQVFMYQTVPISSAAVVVTDGLARLEILNDFRHLNKQTIVASLEATADMSSADHSSTLVDKQSTT